MGETVHAGVLSTRVSFGLSWNRFLELAPFRIFIQDRQGIRWSSE